MNLKIERSKFWKCSSIEQGSGICGSQKNLILFSQSSIKKQNFNLPSKYFSTFMQCLEEENKLFHVIELQKYP